MGEKYFFKQPLQEAVIIKRNSQFTIDVMLNNKEIRCHCPTTDFYNFYKALWVL